MRLGNLMGRSTDGKFQINPQSNAFVGYLRAFETLGAFPRAASSQSVDLTPIDSVASAIVLLAGAPGAHSVFHPLPPKRVVLGDLIATMRAEGIAIKTVSGRAFARLLAAAMRDETKINRLTSLVAYQNTNKRKALVSINVDTYCTTRALEQYAWQWPEIGADYLRKFVRELVGQGVLGGR
jgi:nucleoside-diphosphate-sugar epimerase